MDHRSSTAATQDRIARPTLLLGDDHNILLEGVRKLLENDYELIGSAADGGTLVADASRLQPDLIVLDISMPVLNGIQAARRIRQRAPNAKIVFLTQQSDRAYLQEAFLAGASAYLLKQSAAGELLGALRQVFQGGCYISRSLAEAFPDFEGTAPAGVSGTGQPVSFTPRQREVLELIAQGKVAEEIAASLGISIRTVEFHQAAIMGELGLRTPAELTQYAIAQIQVSAGGGGRPIDPGFE